MSNNNVTVKIDSRVFYGLVAILAVAGIFAIGMYLGGAIGGPAKQQAADVNSPPPVGAVVDPVAPGAVPTADPLAAAVNPAAAGAQTAVQPVSVEEAPVGASEPRIWIDEPSETAWTVDMGTIPGDKATEKDFTIRNIGTALLVIEDASASCGCTAAHVGKKELAPGETSQVRVSYDPRVNSEQGKFVQKQVRIKSNDPKTPLVEFTIQADVAAQ
ncbi:MAG: DUF1573 domain-containing protein [Ardenticatenales bacterium]|nr:DUF1573 domain-containing protein [Ardenticatenales bacterium]